MRPRLKLPLLERHRAGRHPLERHLLIEERLWGVVLVPELVLQLVLLLG
jgi:hypothetical protein